MFASPSRPRRRLFRFLWAAVGLLLVPSPAHALELLGGVSIGGIIVGTEPRLAVRPHAAVAWRLDNGVSFSAHELCSILPATNALGVGVYNHTSATIGYSGQTAELSIGPALGLYSMPACGSKWCGRVTGVSPGAHASVQVYLAGPLGVSASANVDWVGGRSLVLPGGVSAMVVAGPVLRWRSN